MLYLDLLDGLLAFGAGTFGAGFRREQLSCVLARQTDDGGFPGRRGGADTYYTDFAVRLLALLGPADQAALESARRASEYITRAADGAGDVVHCFSVLNSSRILGDRLGFPPQIDRDQIAATVGRQALPGGGYARPEGFELSAYDTFIAALCYELLDRPLPNADAPARIVSGLQGSGGGFRELPGEGPQQTNATAAAVAFLTMTGAITPKQSADAADFLAGMQATDGGFRAHADVPVSDLLSTFTALVALAGLDALGAVNVPGVARFLKLVAIRGGGFRSCEHDDAGDPEYHYYGVGCMAILKAHLEAQDTSLIS